MAVTMETTSGSKMTTIRVVLFDYGGVLAEEGFREGLFSIALQQGLEPDAFYQAAQEGVYDSGFVIGKGTESDFWHYMRERFSLQGDDASLSTEILQHFVLRPRMVALVRSLRRRGFLVGILSDQTVWLDQLDQRDRFYREFDRLYISYRLGKGKRDASLFDDVADDLDLSPDKLVFIDDNQGNVKRACSRGMNEIEFISEEDCLVRLEALLGQSLHDVT
ncbi:MAG: HAD family phosphatase [Gammaproteobacteria bacterium]|nr:HAD family phosphatase [Gammaproteobacteria bacterium]